MLTTRTECGGFVEWAGWTVSGNWTVYSGTEQWVDESDSTCYRCNRCDGVTESYVALDGNSGELSQNICKTDLASGNDLRLLDFQKPKVETPKILKKY